MNKTNKFNRIKMSLWGLSLVLVTGCDATSDSAHTATSQTQINPEVLPFLDAKKVPAKLNLPRCKNTACILLEVQTITSQDPWLNLWIEQHQANAIQQQIGLKQPMRLQQAMDAYVKKSNAWQHEFVNNRPYALDLTTHIAAQRNQYVLLQISLDSQQGDLKVEQRQYFFVADRKLHKNLKLLDVIQSDQQQQLNQWLQVHYKKWLAAQTKAVQHTAAKKLDWRLADWFFDLEGIGLHYRANEIAPDGAALDIYLSKQQTQTVLRPEVLKRMF